MKVDHAQLEVAVTRRLVEAGVPEHAATEVTRHLLLNERLKKESHGLFRLPGIVRAAGSIEPGTDCIAEETLGGLAGPASVRAPLTSKALWQTLDGNWDEVKGANRRYCYTTNLRPSVHKFHCISPAICYRKCL